MVGVQGSGDCGKPPLEADQLAEDTEERSPEEPIRLSVAELQQTNCSRTSTEFAIDLLQYNASSRTAPKTTGSHCYRTADNSTEAGGRLWGLRGLRALGKIMVLFTMIFQAK